MKKSKKLNPPEKRIMAGEEEFRLYLRQLCAASSQKNVARLHHLTAPQLSAIIHGKAPVGETIASRFGFSLQETKTFIPKES